MTTPMRPVPKSTAPEPKKATVELIAAAKIIDAQRAPVEPVASRGSKDTDAADEDARVDKTRP
jgi:hypothetical protein